MLKFLTPPLRSNLVNYRPLMLSTAMLIGGWLNAQVATSYTFSQGSGSYSEITGGTLLWGGFAGSFDNQVSGAQTIPSFNFNGTTYTQMYVSANGFVTFGSAPSGTNFTPISGGATYAGAISAFGADIENRSDGFNTRDVRWQTVGNEVVIQWRNARRQNVSNENLNCQIRLNTATNVVRMIYGSSSGQSSTSFQPEVGLRGADNTFSTNVNNRTVGSGAENWASSLVGADNASKMRFTSTAPAKGFTSGLTYTFTPCASPALNVTPANPSYCTGGSTSLTASGATSYTWVPATGLSATTGASVTANPTTTTTYTVTGLNAGCAFAGTTTVTVSVQSTPSAPVITPSSATTCAGSGQSLTASATSSGTVNSTFNSTGGPATVTTGAAQNASIYPWNLTVSGLPVSGVTVASVTINGITHAFSDDLDILLQSATGTNVVLMSDIGGGNAISAVAYTFATGSPALADGTANPTGTYAPTNIGASDDYPTSPGPGNGFSQGSPTLTSFTGNFNGTWKLLIRDDGNGDAGSITSWNITFVVPATVSYTWTPNVALSATTGATVTASPTSAQTYTVTASHDANGCTNLGSVTITTVTPPNAGSDNSLTICSNDGPADMAALLGAHDAGTWNGPSPVVSDLYDPATMVPGNYVYTVAAAPCPNATATISVTENTAVNWYADTDGDGFGDGATTGLACSAPNAGDVTNNTDLCPTDATKQAPGQCGCGNPETDTDSDGTADCNDLCPLDANKVAPGICGCGMSDVDTDLDGTADCNDGCPLDANKTIPGICGCGVSDMDTDSDGTADCIDGCPNDANKTTPGICGCGVSDVDTDLDGTADCNDGCPTDVNKIAPGQCGCGNADTDTDSDGTADCNDLCPLDANKIAPGQCGCGNADTDTDIDGTADCNDGCPNDANKTSPGTCGCGVSDTDTDLDGTADCNDGCPIDPNKTSPGVCGCGVSEGTCTDCAGVVNGAAAIDQCGVCAGGTTGTTPNESCLDCAGVPNGGAAIDQCGVCAGGGTGITPNSSCADCLGTPNGSALPGTACDDNNANTAIDTWSAACACEGLLVDCLGVPGGSTLPGTPCDDNDGGTENDIYGADCACAGTAVPVDCNGDANGSASVDACGICAGGNTGIVPNSTCLDCNGEVNGSAFTDNCGACVGGGTGLAACTQDCLGAWGGSALPGVACDDNDAATENDVYGNDCACAGTPIPVDCNGDANGTAAIDACGVCAGGNTGIVPNSTCLDCLGSPNGSALPGTACDDNNANTGNDTWTFGCTCEGTLIDCEGTIGGGALPGTACDDDNAATANDTWGAGCECTGILMDCIGVPGGDALPGSACDDGVVGTLNDMWSPECVCAGEALDCEGTVGGDALPGTICDDGNANTGDDHWTANCLCIGEIIDCEGVAGGNATIGTGCDDGDLETENDLYGTDCICAGTAIPYDCIGVANGTALPGTSCDDGDFGTGNDMWTSNCLCVGQLIDCLGVIGGGELPGTSCDDNNPDTGNDTWNGNCGCVGQMIDCEGVTGGTALPGMPCDDGINGNGTDLWTIDCNCVGNSNTLDCEGTLNGTAMPGTPCDDANEGTGNDSWNLQCACVGTPIDCAGVIGGTAVVDDCGVCAGGTTGVMPNADEDQDGALDCADNCPGLANGEQMDFDTDGVGDLCDNCAWVANPGQEDSNGNGIGDQCEEIGIAENSTTSFSVFPNPTNGHVVIMCGDASVRTLNYFDLSGKLIYTAPFAIRSDVSALAMGSYVVIALDAEGRPLARTRLVKN